MSVIKCVRCGWCGALISGAPTAIPEEESTGICLPCKRRIEAEYEGLTRDVCPCGEVLDDFGACANCDAPPLVKGGQGREAPEVIDSAAVAGICFTAILLIVAVAWALSGTDWRSIVQGLAR